MTNLISDIFDKRRMIVRIFLIISFFLLCTRKKLYLCLMEHGWHLIIRMHILYSLADLEMSVIHQVLWIFLARAEDQRLVLFRHSKLQPLFGVVSFFYHLLKIFPMAM